jgi:hypothetical protein
LKDSTQDLVLSRQVFYHLSHASVLLLLACFPDRISSSCPGPD